MQRAKNLLLHYPKKPTGGVATRGFFSLGVGVARPDQHLLFEDVGCSALVFEGQPLSFLSIPGAKDVGVEIHSMSKAFNMTGWRLAWVCGNALIVRAFADVRDNFDSGHFKAIQKAAMYALQHPAITPDIPETY